MYPTHRASDAKNNLLPVASISFGSDSRKILGVNVSKEIFVMQVLVTCEKKSKDRLSCFGSFQFNLLAKIR